jgi:hypothetical protein
MPDRRWRAGQSVERDGIRYAVEKGVKHPDDLRMRIWVPAGLLLPMSVLAVAADFLSENEDVIAKPHWKDTGEQHLTKYMKAAMRHGYSFADALYVKAPQRGLFDKEVS